MNTFLLIKSLSQLADLSSLRGLPAIASQALAQHTPDAHWVLVQDEQAIAAHCSLWWQSTPLYRNERLGLIGHYMAQDAQSAKQLLCHACEQLAFQGCTMSVGPMDGTTWRRYRAMSDRGTEPVFFLEPDNPDDWCNHFQNAEFTALATYSSALNSDLSQQDLRIERVERRLRDVGVAVRSLDLQNFEQELQHIHELSLISFRNNFLYSPIEQAEFVSQYSQIRSYLRPELVLIAEHNGHLVGFLFAIPDLLQAKRGEKVNTVIIKTVAVLPNRIYAGLGSFLVATVQAIAYQQGYTRAIHALMHDANNSRNLSDRYARTIRRYTLFGKQLGG